MTHELTPVAEAAHAVLGASGWKKWSTCTMSVAVEKGIPEENSDFSREGTYAHAVAEARLLSYLAGNESGTVRVEDADLVDVTKNEDAAEFLNTTFIRHVDTFVDYVIERHKELVAEHGADNVMLLLEQRLRFDRWVPEGFGTADVVFIVPGKVIVVDLKFGAGVYVDGENNGQIKLYGLAAWHAYNPVYEFNEIEVVIHQPRMNNISGETIKIDGFGGLLDWAENVVKPRSKIAWAAYNGDYSNARFAPGEHCSTAFCKARFACAARARYLLEIAELPYVHDEPHTLTVEQLEAVVTKADLAAKWAKDVQAYLLRQASEQKVELKKFKVVEGRSFREVKDTTKAATILMSNGYAAAKVYKEPELRNLGDLERLVGAKKLTDLLGDLLHKPTGKLTLVPREDSKPVAQQKKPGSTKDFDDIDD